MVRDNGVVQKVDFVGFDEVPINLVLTFDVSGSVTGRKLEDLRSAGHAIVDQLRAGDRAAMISFTQTVSPNHALSANFSLVRSMLDARPQGGQTSLLDATFAGLISGLADNGRSLLLVFTDGVDTASWLEPGSLIEAAKLGDVVVFGVSAGRLRAPILKTLAETTGGEMFEVRSTNELRATFVQLINEYRQRYLVAYSPTGLGTGWHTVDISVSKRGARIHARPGYLRR